MNEPKTIPIPAPAPAKPKVANPAPIIFAGAKKIAEFFLYYL